MNRLLLLLGGWAVGWFAACGLALDATPQAADLPKVTRLTRTYFPKAFLSYSPDGSHLVYSRHHANRRASNKVLTGLRIIRADGSDDRPLLPQFEHLVQIQEHGAWSPDGKSLLLTGGGNDLGNAAKDTFRCDLSSDFKASNLRKLIPGQAVMMGEQPAWSPDGKEIAVVTMDHSLWVASADGKNKRKLLQAGGNYLFQPAWSPDGEWIAFSSDRDGDPEIYKIRSDGDDLMRLTKSPSIDCRPKWSPDGQWIVFTSNRTGNNDLFLMRADGSDARNLTRHPALDDHAAWSPDGRSIAFVSMRDGGFDLYRLELPADVKVGKTPPRRAGPAPEAAGGLVAHYDFDGDSGTALRNRVTGRHALQLSGARLVSEKGRGALAFDGKGSHASAGNAPALQIAGPLTISLWVRPTASTSNGYLLSKHGWNIYLSPDLRPHFETRNASDTVWDTLAATVRLEPGRWGFVTAVFDPKKQTLAIYVDGKPAGSKARTDGKIGGTQAQSLELGTYGVSRAQAFRGLLNELRIYRAALGAEDVAREFKAQSAKVSR